MYAPSLLDPAAESLRNSDFTGATEVAREARTLLGERFSSVTFMYVLMRAFEVEYTAACDLTWLKLVRTAVVNAGEGIAEVVG